MLVIRFLVGILIAFGCILVLKLENGPELLSSIALILVIDTEVKQYLESLMMRSILKNLEKDGKIKFIDMKKEDKDDNDTSSN